MPVFEVGAEIQVKKFLQYDPPIARVVIQVEQLRKEITSRR